MSFPKIVPQSQIDEMRKHQKKGPFTPAQAEAEERKALWLAVFEKCLSPKIACRRIGISMNTYRLWKTNDPDFAEALNESLYDWREELHSSALGRAIGYTKPSSETESGFDEDAEGKPIRYNASDPMAKMYLQGQINRADLEADEETTVVINMAALAGDDNWEPDNVNPEGERRIGNLKIITEYGKPTFPDGEPKEPAMLPSPSSEEEDGEPPTAA